MEKKNINSKKLKSDFNIFMISIFLFLSYSIFHSINTIAGDKEVVIYGAEMTEKPAFASAYAVSSGFPIVYYFENGLEKWKEAGYRIER